MLDLTAVRMFCLDKVAETPFTIDDEKALAAVVLAYAYTPMPDRPDGTRIPIAECVYLLESFGYDVRTLGLSHRQFLTGLLPHYSLASKHPILVGQIYQLLVEPAYRARMIQEFDNQHPPEPIRK